MPATYNVIDTFLAAFLNAIDGGFGLISPDVMNVFSILIVITIGITAVFWALDENNTVVAGLFRKTLLIGFFGWLLSDWNNLTKTIVLGFAQLGLKAGGSSMPVGSFITEPSKLVYMGMTLVTQMSVQLKDLSGPVGFFENFALILIIGAAAIGVIIAFVILAVQVFVLIIEFRLVTLAAFVLVPFGILKQTSFLADRALGYVVSSGCKVLAIAVIVSIGGKTFSTLTLAPIPSIESAVSVLIASVVLVMLALTVPSIAAALITGGPQLGAGAALAGAAGVAAGAGAAYLAGRASYGAGGKVADTAKAAAGAVRRAGSGSPGPGEGSGGQGMQPANPPGGGSAPAATAAKTSAAGSGSSGSAAAPSTAPAPAETVRRAIARKFGTPSGHAQVAMAAANAQSGVGMTTKIDASEG